MYHLLVHHIWGLPTETPGQRPPPRLRPSWTETPWKEPGTRDRDPRSNMGPGSQTRSDITPRPPVNRMTDTHLSKFYLYPKLRLQAVTMLTNVQNVSCMFSSVDGSAGDPDRDGSEHRYIGDGYHRVRVAGRGP